MDIFASMAAALKIVWVIVGLAIITLLLGWLVGALLARWADAALRRIPLFRLVMQRLRISNEDQVRPGIRQVVRALPRFDIRYLLGEVIAVDVFERHNARKCHLYLL